ncbi:hypothetical protein J3459_016380 [Metarhizium acridum]|nr:hypothetical protein J3459_016380 [Metarhizium acridum]
MATASSSWVVLCKCLEELVCGNIIPRAFTSAAYVTATVANRTSVLGIDFGSMCSKLTLATAYGEDGVRVLRVMANVPNEHPERRPTP